MKKPPFRLPGTEHAPSHVTGAHSPSEPMVAISVCFQRLRGAISVCHTWVPPTGQPASRGGGLHPPQLRSFRMLSISSPSAEPWASPALQARWERRLLQLAAPLELCSQPSAGRGSLSGWPAVTTSLWHALYDDIFLENLARGHC